MTPQPGTAHRSRRLILQASPSPADVSRVAEGEGWQEIGTRVTRGLRKKAVHSAWKVSAGVTVSYLQDHKERTSYMVLTSQTTPDLEPHLERLVNTGLDFATVYQLLEDVSLAPHPKVRGLAVVRSGIGAPRQPTKPYVHAFFEAIRDPSPTVRLSAVTAIGYAEWPEFLELLDAVAVRDDDREVRRHAGSMAAAYRKAAALRG